MFSLKETSKAFSAAALIKQSSEDSEVRSAVDAFFASLGTNAIIITDHVDTLDDVIIIDDDNPVNASIQELTKIAEAGNNSVKAACNDIIEKLNKIIELS